MTRGHERRGDGGGGKPSAGKPKAGRPKAGGAKATGAKSGGRKGGKPSSDSARSGKPKPAGAGRGRAADRRSSDRRSAAARDTRDARPDATRGVAREVTPIKPSGPFVELSRIVHAPASAVFRMVNDPTKRDWAPERLYRITSALPPRFARLAFPDGSQAAIAIVRQGNTRTAVSVEHTMLPESVDADVLRRRWNDALAALSEALDSDWG